MLVSFVGTIFNALCIESANVVGYTTENIQADGQTINRFKKPSGEPTRLDELLQEIPSGTEISFFDGNEWVVARADIDTKGNVHWFNRNTDQLIDDYEVPVGAGIRYRLPRGTSGTIIFNGEIRDSYLGEAAAIFDGGITLDDVRLPQNAVEDILNTLPIVTNKITVTNTPPNRFALRMRSGELRSAMWDTETLALCDPKTGFNFKFPLSAVERFEVDNSAPQETRMIRSSVARLEELYLTEVIKERKDKEEARKKEEEAKIAESLTRATENVTESVIARIRALMKRSITWLIAILGFMASTVFSYYIGKGLDRINPLLKKFFNKLARR